MRRSMFALAGVAVLAVAALALALSSGTVTVQAVGEGGAGPVTCVDGIDNDGDTLVDGADPDCLVPPLTIDAGYDFLETISGSYITVGGIPAAFFGTEAGVPSDPIPGPVRVDLKGLPTGPLVYPPADPPVNLEIKPHCDPPPPFPNPKHCHNVTHLSHGLIDTIIIRHTDALLPGLGDTDEVEIEIVSLSLVNANPIQVTYGGGAASSFFDVFIELDPASVQVRGNSTWTRTDERSGTFDSFLPVTARATFTNTDPGGPSAMGPVVQEFRFGATGAPWSLPRPVGGTVSLRADADTPAEASDSSSARDYTAPIAAAAGAAVVALAAGGWYVRRRLS